MKSKYYKRDGTPYADQDVLAWAKDFEKDRRVTKNVLSDGKEVSTVFLGLDHNFTPNGPPLIFETMVFPGETGGEELDMERYSTEQEALKGHEAMVHKWEKKKEKEGEAS